MITLMFHSVGNDQSLWTRRYLSISIKHFERFCLFLAKKKYRTLLFDEWFYLQNHPETNTGEEIVLTFDDGYLDNWVFACPILKKYGLKGTVFINPEFVDPLDKVRPNLEDVWAGNVNRQDLQTLGFLSWPEIQKMDAENVIQAQSHSMSHNFYFHSDKLIDFYLGQTAYDWLAWFHAPERKPFYITEEQTGLIPFGYPVFKHGRALGLRRFFPAKSLVDAFSEKAQSLRDKGLGNDIIIKELFTAAEGYLDKNGSYGRYETDKEMEARYRYELFESKRILEEKMNHPVEYLCWPGGGYNDYSIALSKEAGYKASTLAGKDKTPGFVNSGEYKRIAREGTGSFVYKKNQRIPAPLPNHLIYFFQAKCGGIFPRIVLKLQKLFV